MFKKDIILSILRVLPEVYWCRFKCNKKIVALMKLAQTEDLPKNLLKTGRLESLGSCEIDVKCVFVNKNIDVIRRYMYGRELEIFEWEKCLYTAIYHKNKAGIEYIQSCLDEKEWSYLTNVPLNVACHLGEVDEIVRLCQKTTGNCLGWPEFLSLTKCTNPDIFQLVPETLLKFHTYGQHIPPAISNACTARNVVTVKKLFHLYPKNKTQSVVIQGICSLGRNEYFELLDFENMIKEFSSESKQWYQRQAISGFILGNNLQMVKHISHATDLVQTEHLKKAIEYSEPIFEYFISQGKGITMEMIHLIIANHKYLLFNKYIKPMKLTGTQLFEMMTTAHKTLAKTIIYYLSVRLVNYWQNVSVNSHDTFFLQNSL